MTRPLLIDNCRLYPRTIDVKTDPLAIGHVEVEFSSWTDIELSLRGPSTLDPKWFSDPHAEYRFSLWGPESNEGADLLARAATLSRMGNNEAAIKHALDGLQKLTVK